MPKQKTHKGAYARLGITARGKLLRRKSHVNNYRRKKHRRSKKDFDEMIAVDKTMVKKLKKLLPYGAR